MEEKLNKQYQQQQQQQEVKQKTKQKSKKEKATAYNLRTYLHPRQTHETHTDWWNSCLHKLFLQLCNTTIIVTN